MPPSPSPTVVQIGMTESRPGGQELCSFLLCGLGPAMLSCESVSFQVSRTDVGHRRGDPKAPQETVPGVKGEDWTEAGQTGPQRTDRFQGQAS